MESEEHHNSVLQMESTAGFRFGLLQLVANVEEQGINTHLAAGYPWSRCLQTVGLVNGIEVIKSYVPSFVSVPPRLRGTWQRSSIHSPHGFVDLAEFVLLFSVCDSPLESGHSRLSEYRRRSVDPSFQFLMTQSQPLVLQQHDEDVPLRQKHETS